MSARFTNALTFRQLIRVDLSSFEQQAGPGSGLSAPSSSSQLILTTVCCWAGVTRAAIRNDSSPALHLFRILAEGQYSPAVPRRSSQTLENGNGDRALIGCNRALWQQLKMASQITERRLETQNLIMTLGEGKKALPSVPCVAKQSEGQDLHQDIWRMKVMWLLQPRECRDPKLANADAHTP